MLILMAIFIFMIYGILNYLFISVGGSCGALRLKASRHRAVPESPKVSQKTYIELVPNVCRSTLMCHAASRGSSDASQRCGCCEQMMFAKMSD